MMIFRFRFSEPIEERVWRDRLRHHAGARLSSERCVETTWSADGGGAAQLEILSMDGIALAYAARVSVDLGGERVPLTPGPWTPAEWTATRWSDHSWMSRLRIRIGPTKI